MRTHLRRALLGLLTTALLAGGSLAAPAEAAPNRPARAAFRWLDGELHQGRFASGGFALYGPTLDYYFALKKLDAKPRVRAQILDSLEVHRGEYVGTGGETYAGAAAKLLTAVEVAGIDPSTFGGGNLVPRLRSLVHTANDSEQGRASDASKYGDFSSTFSQVWVVRAFARHKDPLLRMTTRFLLKQQCARGFFRESLDSRDHTCQTGRRSGKSDPSVDATALAVMALKAARRSGVPRLGDDLHAALRWLRRHQNRNGSFTGNGVANANSTGLAAWVLADAGSTKKAAKAAEWLRRRQVTRADARGTALAGQLGAVAYNKKAFRQGKHAGITDGDVRSQWILATAQAAVGLDSRGR